MAEKRTKFGALFTLCLLELSILLLEFQVVSSLKERLPRQALKWYDQRVQFKDLAGAFMDSSPESGNNYRALIFNSSLSELYVGGKEKLNIVNATNMNIKKGLTIRTDESALSTCKVLNPTALDMCFNYVRIIQPFDGDNVFVCGTNAKQPKCYFVNSSSLVTEADPNFSAANSVPTEPDQSTSWVYLAADSALLRAVGTEASKTGSNYNIHLSNFTGTTYDDADVDADNNQEWLSSPEFVGDPFEYNGHIYFFFREFAVEHINGGRIIYSRVGRVCKNDTGGEKFTNLVQEFTTYQKARLDCSLRENELDFNYNYMQDVYRSGLAIFAVFTTQSVGMVSSALCAYSLEEIAQLFNVGQFSGQAANGQLWTTPNPSDIPDNVFQCDALPVPDSSYAFIRKYPLMNLAVPNKLNYGDQSTNDYLRESDAPLFVIDDVRLTQIVVDHNVNGVDVFFLGTEHGTIIKAYLNEDKSNAYLIEEIDLNVNESVPQAPILTMLKDATQDHIYASTDNNVYKVPVQSLCSAAMNECKCCCGLDPYCSMNDWDCVPSMGGAAVESCSDLKCNCSAPTVPVVAGPITVVRRAPCLNTPSLQDVCETVVPENNQTNLNFAAYAPEGSNLRSSMVTCDDCGDTPVTSVSSSICSGREFVTVNAFLNVKSNCTCRIYFTSDTETTGALVTKITVDTSDRIHNRTCITEADDYDVEIKDYKRKLRIWNLQKIEKYCPTNTTCKATCSSQP